MIRRIFSIFLASPNDLQDERRVSRDVVDRINKVLNRRMSINIDLLGWEDRLPGFSRPQDLINKDVDSCDLFLGILWRRWGQPTKKYESGFEEEFARARERREKTGKPEIWLYFKSIDVENLQDPGDQLKKVIKFKTEQIDRKELLFKEFSDTQAWREIIYDNLLAYVIDLDTQERMLAAQEQSKISEHMKESPSPVEATAHQETPSFPSQLLSLFEKINNNLKQDPQVELDLLERTRLFLQSSAWFSQQFSHELFGIHEVNLLYKHGKQWDLSRSERWYVFRSFIADTDDLLPGWYFIDGWDETGVDKRLVFLALRDGNLNVRRQAVKILAESGYEASGPVIEKLLSDEDHNIVLQGIEFVKKTRKIELLHLLDPIIQTGSTNLQNVAKTARIEIQYQNDPNAAFVALIDSGISPPRLIRNTLKDLSLRVDDGLLFKALDHTNNYVRQFCAEYLRRKGLLSKEYSQKLLKDTDPFVRKEALLRLIELDEPYDIETVEKLFPKSQETILGRALSPHIFSEDFIPLILRRRNASELLASLDFYSSNTETIYQILATEHFEVIEPRLRSDLDDDFESFRAESEIRFKEKYGAALANSLKEWKPETILFMKGQLIAAALQGLALNGREEDIRYGRKFLRNTRHNIADEAAIFLISKFGNQQDVEKLLKAIGEISGNAKRLAFDAAFKLSPNPIDFLNQMSRSEDGLSSKWAFELLAKQESSDIINFCRETLNSKVENQRLGALGIICKRYGSEALQNLLNDYLAQDSYYYNVVAWLDRYLYSKGKYKSYYGKKIESFISVDPSGIGL